MHELKCFSDHVSGEQLRYWPSTSGFEVDFILGDHTAIEAKAKKTFRPMTKIRCACWKKRED
jgi:uncharacterized protein